MTFPIVYMSNNRHMIDVKQTEIDVSNMINLKPDALEVTGARPCEVIFSVKYSVSR